MMKRGNHHIRAGLTEVGFLAFAEVANNYAMLCKHFQQSLCRTLAFSSNNHGPLVGDELLHAFGGCFSVTRCLTPSR